MSRFRLSNFCCLKASMQVMGSMSRRRLEPPFASVSFWAW